MHCQAVGTTPPCRQTDTNLRASTLSSDAGPFDANFEMDGTGTYRFQVEAFANTPTGQRHLYSQISTITFSRPGLVSCNIVADLLPSPTNLQARPSGNSINVSWDPIPCSGATYTIIAAIANRCWELNSSCSIQQNVGTSTSGSLNPSSLLQERSSGYSLNICVQAHWRDPATGESYDSRWDAACASATGGTSAPGSDIFTLNPDGTWRASQATQGDCGCESWARSVATGQVIQKAICESTCAVSRALGGIVEWIVQRLIEVSGVSYEAQWARQLTTRCWVSLL